MRFRNHLLVLCLILPVLALCGYQQRPMPFDRYDQRFYLGIAYDLRHHHRFTDGFAYAGGDATTLRPPGMRFTPLYPALLAAAASVAPGFAAATDCVVAHSGAAGFCGNPAGPVRPAQVMMLAAVFWMLWWCATEYGGSAAFGWLALLAALATAPVLLRSADDLMTEAPSLFLIVASQTLSLRASGRHRHRAVAAFVAGAILGLAILTRPAFLLLLPAAAAAGMLCGRRVWARTAWFCVGSMLVIGPWLLRNLVVMHRLALTFGYASHTFVQRLAFDRMTWPQYRLSFVCWLPDGAGLGRMIGGAHACDPFGWDEHPDSFYSIGTGPMLRRTLAQAGGFEHHMRFLVDHFLLQQPLRQIGFHLAVTVPLALRGVAIDHWWGLVLSVPAAILTLRCLRRPCRQARIFLLLALPGWFMLGLNSAIAVDQPRYNLMLVPPFAVAAAAFVVRYRTALKVS